MLELFVYGAAALLAAILVVVAYAATKPNSFSVERSTTIGASPADIYPLIADLRAMNTWNPFVEPDPGIEITYAGPPAGAGAIHTWRGNRNVGEGRIEITEATPNSSIVMQLDMLKPMEAHNRVVFTLQPIAGGTKVTWAMSGAQPLLGKIMTVFIDCDRMVGSRFEAGLAKLSTLAGR